MKRERLIDLFSDAQVDINSPNLQPASLSTLANKALALTGLRLEEIHTIEQAFTNKEQTSAVSLSIGSGFAAWTIAQSSGMLDHALEEGHEIGLFVLENLDVLTAGWDEAVPVVADFLSEFILKLPGGSLELGRKILDLFDKPELLAEALGMKLDYGIEMYDALELVGLGADAADLMEGAFTLGGSLVLSWAAGKLTKKYYEPQIQERMDRLQSLLARNIELIKLRKLLKTELPSAVIAGQLERVDIRHWGF